MDTLCFDCIFARKKRRDILNYDDLYNALINEEDDSSEVSYEERFKNQYHPAYCAAIELELREDKEHLLYNKEYNLNSKPNEVDLLVIETDNNKVKSGIGSIFKKHNFFEFKNPKDSLDIRMYYRTMGYVNLYLAYESDDIPIEDVSISFLREGYPRKLMKWFEIEGFDITAYEDGIYYVRKYGHVDMQVIVTSRLSKSYAWVTKISSKLEKEDFIKMCDEFRVLDDDKDCLNAESVMDLSVRLNKDKEDMKEVIGMGVIKEMFDENRKTINELKNQLQNKDQQLQNKDEKLQNKDEQLQNKDEQLQKEIDENTKLRKEIEDLKKLVGNKIAMF